MIDTSTLITDVVAECVFGKSDGSVTPVKYPSVIGTFAVANNPDADYFIGGNLLQTTVADCLIGSLSPKVDGTNKIGISFVPMDGTSDYFRVGPLTDMVGYEYNPTAPTGGQTVRQYWGS